MDAHSQEADTNIVEIWLRKDPKRWLAGILGGLFAGLVMLAVAMGLCAAKGLDPTLPVKLAALPILGGQAAEFGSMPGLITGFVVHELMCAFLGFYYAHVTGGNSRGLLFGMGITWGLFGWIFITCLFTPSFRSVLVQDFPRGIALFAWIAYGIALMSVGFFDKKIRGQR